jgi:hypothetical protein
MKTKFLKTLLVIAILATASPTISMANIVDPVIEQREMQAKRLTDRLEEIRGMDTKSMTKKEKKALRKEVKTIKKELAAVSGGVYLSIGAILLIALLLILLL